MNPIPNRDSSESASDTTSKLSAMEMFLLFCIALGFGLRALWASKREFWYDEVLSVLLSSGQKNAYKLPDSVPFAAKDMSSVLSLPTENGVAGAIETVKNLVKGTLGDPHPPLFYLNEHGWMRIFGNGEGALRSLVVIVSLVTLLLSYYFGKRVLGQLGGLVFTALLALNPFFFSHSLNLRMYAAMLLWVMVSGVCFFALIGLESLGTEGRTGERTEGKAEARGWQRWLLRAGVAISLTAGLLTQYLFAYWLFALAALVLYLDRKRWFQHGLTMGAGVLMFMPWALWGVRQQAKNRADVLSQISSVGGPFQAAIAHGKDLVHTLANHLLLGHLTTSMLPIGEPIKPTAVAIGCAVLGFLMVCVVGLYRRRQYRVLMIGVLAGLLPLAVALAIDVAANKYTLGFGWGRSTIVALPGCLLLIAAWLERATGRWRVPMTAGLLAVYLAVNVGDFVGRDRQIFHQVNDTLLETESPTLVVMNSRAWGHVLRLTYYLAESPNAYILATKPADVTDSLARALQAESYARVLWLRAEYPLWDKPESEAEAQLFSDSTEKLLQANYQLADTQALSGTMNLDEFELQVYQKPA
ncbi:MAG: glycosyltransferase family 39 protein [Cyanobacteria bacterium P01_F01_bin.53]